MGKLKKLKNLLRLLYSLPMSLYFNFRFLPFSQALKLPVLLYRASVSGKGKYIIEAPISPGMIRLGFPMVSIFREKGIVLENNGLIVFKGTATIGGGSGISVGNKGEIFFGDRFSNQSGIKLISYHKIDMGSAVRIGWQSMVCDTDFHTMKSEDGEKRTQGYGPIRIGDEVWVGSYCKLFKNTDIPSKCTVASGTFLNKKIDCRPYSLIYPGGGVKVKYTGFLRDIDDDRIDYE